MEDDSSTLPTPQSLFIDDNNELVLLKRKFLNAIISSLFN